MLAERNFYYLLFIIGIIIPGCGLIEEAQNTIAPILPKNNLLQKRIVEKKNISISCQSDDIKNYTNKGWKIISSSKKEVTCRWKSIPSRRGCDMNSDKGCRITVPDKIGEQIKYELEREKALSKNNQI